MYSKFQNVLSWAAYSIGEGNTCEKYYWTPPIKTALFRLTNYESYFIGLIGLVGTGKSSAVTAIKTSLGQEIQKRNDCWIDSERREKNEERKLAGEAPLSAHEQSELRDKLSQEVLAVKWKGNLWTTFHEDLEYTSARKKYLDALHEHLRDAPKARRVIKEIESTIRINCNHRLSESEIKRRACEQFRRDIGVAEAEELISEKLLGRIRTSIVRDFLERKVHTLLIDMPDYSQKGSWKINKDLDEIGLLWGDLKNTSRINILVCLQQELVMKQPHLILGKMDKIVLKTLTIEQLLEAYMQFFGTFEPFTEDALRLIAKLSRGVFRRFKNYVRLSLELVSIEGLSDELISVQVVSRAITKEQLRMDMNLELGDFFKNQDRKSQAFDVLDFVRESGNPKLTQKSISDALGIHPNVVGDVVKQLCLHNYLQVDRGKGSELLVSLKE